MREGFSWAYRGTILQGGITEGSHARAREEDEMRRHSRVDVDVRLAKLLVFVLVRKMGLFRVELERAQCTWRSVRYSVTH